MAYQHQVISNPSGGDICRRRLVGSDGTIQGDWEEESCVGICSVLGTSPSVNISGNKGAKLLLKPRNLPPFIATNIKLDSFGRIKSFTYDELLNKKSNKMYMNDDSPTQTTATPSNEGLVTKATKLLSLSDPPHWAKALPLIGAAAGAGLVYHQMGSKAHYSAYLGYCLAGAALFSVPFFIKGYKAVN